MTCLLPSDHPTGSTRPGRRAVSQAGFSLVELLTASGLAGLVFIVLMGLLDGSLRIYQTGSGSLQAYSEARYALSRITDELGSAIILEQTNNPPASDQPARRPANVALVQNHSSLGGLPGVVFVQRRRNAGAGDLILTAYRFDAERFVVERAEIDSDSVWQNNRDYNLQSIPGAWDWREICRGVTRFELGFFTRNDLQSANPVASPTYSTWDSRNHGRPAQGLVTFEVLDPASLSTLAEVGIDSSVGGRLIDEKATTLSRDLRF